MSFFDESFPYPIDVATSFSALADLPWPAWLESGKGCARYDILTAAPYRVLTQAGGDALPDAIAAIRSTLGVHRDSVPGVPFAGGVLGYWSYHWGHESGPAVGAEGMPSMVLGAYDWAVVVDHQLQTMRLLSHLTQPGTMALLEQVRQRLSGSPSVQIRDFHVHGHISSNLDAPHYERAFAAVQTYLWQGDCYQVNLAQRFSVASWGDPLAAFLELRRRSPVPYAAYLNFPQGVVLSASPECFLTVSNGQVRTRPIKGTRPRSADPVRDAELAASLRQHPKDRAENLMIVDLLRNDLGKCCAPGSIRVPELFALEHYANVHQMVSTVEGTLASERDALDVLQQCFPGGSITGAPKKRAMEIIAELEPHGRDVYCGAIGYIGFDGNMDSSIAIRTMVQREGMLRGWAGGGIVADSECAAEYLETLDKASIMLAVMRHFGALE